VKEQGVPSTTDSLLSYCICLQVCLFVGIIIIIVIIIIVLLLYFFYEELIA
jgi:hypothetical protein